MALPDQHVVTIDGKKYDYDTAMKDPVLRARYNYLADDPNGVQIKGLQGQIDSRKGKDPTFTPQIEQQFLGMIADLQKKQGTYTDTQKAPVDTNTVTAQPYVRPVDPTTPPQTTPPGTSTPALPSTTSSTTTPLPNPGISAPPSISLNSIIASQGGNSTNPQTGQVTTAPGYSPPQASMLGPAGATGGSTGSSAPLPTTGGAMASAPPKATSIGSMGGTGSPDYMAQLMKLMVPSLSETQTQGQIDNLNSSAKMGVNEINAEPVPYQTKYGTAKNIYDQTNTQIETLQQKLAREQATRQASLEVSKFALERQDKATADAKEQTRYDQQLSSVNATNSAPAILAVLSSMPDQKSKDAFVEKKATELGVSIDILNSALHAEITKSSNDKLLSVAEAKSLGVPYGTTQAQAAKLGVTPTNSSVKKTSPTPSPIPKLTATSLADAFKTGWQSEGYIQGNGKISSKDYKEAKAEWRNQGFTGSAFDQAMADLIDKSSTNWKQDYGYGS